jgi:hypothetical protein
MRSSGFKTVTAVFVAVLIFIGMAAQGEATTYYVNATSGNDSNSGWSSGTPWKTISKVNSSSFQPGDSILFKRGELWREQLIPPSSGSASSVITFGTYSTGVNPVISGANVVNGLPYMVNDTFTGNAVRGWVTGRGTVLAVNDHLEAVMDGVDNNYGDYITKDTPEGKEGWLMYRFNLVPGYSWTKDQSIIGSGIIDGAFVGVVNSTGSPMFRIRVERNGGFDYYLPAIPAIAEGLWYDIKMHVKSATAAGANDGVVQIWINGVQVFNQSGIASDSKTLKKISMGNSFYAPAGLTMRLALDDVKFSNREINGTEAAPWQPTGSNGLDGAAIYRGYAFYDSSTLFENKIAMKKIAWNTDLATTSAAMQRGNWTLDTRNWIIYVIPSAGGVPDANAYEAATRTNSILVNAKNYTKYEGLELKNSDREALLFMKLSGLEANDLLAHHNGCQGTNLSVVQGQSVSNVYIHDSVLRDSSWNGISVDCYYGPSSNISINNNTIYNNIHNGIDFKASANYSYSNLNVSGNRSYNNGTHGLYMQNYALGAANNATISRNIFFRNYGAGVYVHKYYASGLDHTGIKIYNNTFAYNGAVGGFGPGVYLDAVDSELKGNNFYTDSVTAVASSEYRINGSGDSSNFNNSFDRTRVANLYYNGTPYTLSGFQGLGFESNGSSVNPKFTGEFTNDYTLNWDSPSIDAGIGIPGISTDILGNPIYGTPDLGAFEFQPPYTMGVDKPDTSGNVRIYADGKFRNTAIPSGNGVNLLITPDGGFGTGDYSEWLNVAVNAWETSGIYEKSWSESSPTIGSLSTVHTVGDLQPNTYFGVSVDSVIGVGISGPACSGGVCLSDAQGNIVFTYSGGYSAGSHTFDVSESGATPACVALSNSNCYPSIVQAYQAIVGNSGAILVRNLTLSENLTFDRNISVSITGGYNAGFATRTGTTVVNGGMSVNAGSATLVNINVK